MSPEEDLRAVLRQALRYLYTEHEANASGFDPRCLVCKFLEDHADLFAAKEGRET